MCGIVGLINKNKSGVNLNILQKMAASLNHRGPDDEGHFLDESVGFYHKRLAIIDIPHGKQPMTAESNTIIFNGEIYNYIELREELKKCGHRFKTDSDTEVILKLYQEFGVDFVKRLNGMFAFLIYDKKRNLILAARDHFGIKPLYYYDDKDKLIFASEIKAILLHPSVDAKPNFKSINQYLTFQFVCGQETLFQNVFKIMPGHYLMIKLDSLKMNFVKYWEADFRIDTNHTKEYFTHQLRKLLEDSIRIQLRSDVPVGSHLSGGLDSSIITLLASKSSSQKFKTFTGGFNEEEEFNEVRYAREVAKACNAEIYEVYPTEKEFIDNIPNLIYHLEEPSAGPGLFPQFMVSQFASKEVKVVLGGQGGDEIFGGYARYVVAYLEQAIKGEILQTNEEGEHIVSLKSIIPNLSYLNTYLPMMKAFWKQDAFEDMDRRYFNLIDRMNGSFGIFSEEFTASYNKEEIFNDYQEIFNYPNTFSYYNKMTHFDMVTSLPALLQVEDRVSMAVSLESRVPFLDHRIVNLVASMPPALKFKGAEMKYILKEATKDILPKSILLRKDKMGFPVPFHIWAKNDSTNFFSDILFSKSCKDRGILNIKKITELISKERAFGRKLWGILSLELWFRQFIDHKPPTMTHDDYAIKSELHADQ